MECVYCKNKCIKKGKYKTIQRYQCKECKRYQQDTYTKCRIKEEKQKWVIHLCREGCGISFIARLLQISKSSVQRIIIKIASALKIPVCKEIGQSYEMDELRTFCGNKAEECWVIYAINRTSGKVIDFVVGRRTKENIKQVVCSVLNLCPIAIYTDGLNIYPVLIHKYIHKVLRYRTNRDFF
jgi:IS1 family transposase